MRVDGNTTLGQAAQFLSSKGDQKIVAKHVDGGIELYTKPQSNKLDKIRLKFHDGKLMSRATYKKQLANETIMTLVGRYNQSVHQRLDPVRQRAGLEQSSIQKLTDIFKHIDVNIFDYGAVRANRLADTFGVMERMTGRIASLLDRYEVPEKIPTPMPHTANTVVAGEVSLPIPPANKLGTFPNMNIDGLNYTPTQVMGAGGAGVVVRYDAPGGEPLAVKLPVFSPNTPDPEDQRQIALEEYHVANRLTANNPNALGFSKVVPLANGGLALAGKLATHGDLEKMSSKLKDVTVDTGNTGIPPLPGKITKQERELVALTLIKDAAAGLDKIKRQGDYIHADVKSQNMMIDSNGRAVVIDFGESLQGKKLNPNVKSIVANPLYRAPELKRFDHESKAVKEQAPISLKQELQLELDDYLSKQGVSPEGIQEIGQSWYNMGNVLVDELHSVLNVTETNRAGLFGTSKIDVWGLGTAAFELLVGERVTEDKIEGDAQQFIAERKIADWGKTGFDAIGHAGGLSSKSTGDNRLDSFINGMLRADPEGRSSAFEVETSPVMNRPGVGSPEVRELIKAIASGDEGDIARARSNLTRLLGTV
ncbi:protein kinase domain-containing protein [Rhizobium alvei]|uniref:non-specific serine/threonine protein kinase n=1 Tax=Rhizobium alvei TaxID=1132659 RepID=A0ABT8YT17_9HYPH|nr:hypothetical protein [Rhizobium alvei]MDO6966489.1 hypothetical protein [Rhizobium alvei]